MLEMWQDFCDVINWRRRQSQAPRHSSNSVSASRSKARSGSLLGSALSPGSPSRSLTATRGTTMNAYEGAGSGRGLAG